jgi:hypothetical protein
LDPKMAESVKQSSKTATFGPQNGRKCETVIENSHFWPPKWPKV